MRDCGTCGAYCCRHVAVGIDAPCDEDDFDCIRWYLSHRNVWVSIGFDGGWLVEFRTPCRNITNEGKCADYENRPNICKYYPDVNELCEGETDAPPYKELFKNVRDFERYMKRRG